MGNITDFCNITLKTNSTDLPQYMAYYIMAINQSGRRNKNRVIEKMQYYYSKLVSFTQIDDSIFNVRNQF